MKNKFDFDIIDFKKPRKSNAGRKRLPADQKTISKMVFFRLKENEYDELKKIALENNCSPGIFAKELILEKIKNSYLSNGTGK